MCLIYCVCVYYKLLEQLELHLNSLKKRRKTELLATEYRELLEEYFSENNIDQDGLLSNYYQVMKHGEELIDEQQLE